MSISNRLARKLQQTLGAEAAEDFVDWMRQIDARFDSVETRLGSIEAKLSALDTKISDRFADLIKWSFVFWCSAVFSVAVLAKVLP